MKKINIFWRLLMISVNFVHVLIGKNYLEAKLIDIILRVPAHLCIYGCKQTTYQNNILM